MLRFKDESVALMVLEMDMLRQEKQVSVLLAAS
jgi:hypothetical protein